MPKNRHSGESRIRVRDRHQNPDVVPAKAGNQQKHWTPVSTGVTTFYEFVKYGYESGVAHL
jgi:hypothetical protein